MSTGYIKTFEDLECWKACRKLRLFVVKDVVPTLPKEERFGLTAQLLDAARSTTANLAEGYGRYHYMDNAKFCSNSRGSCWEVLDHLITATDEELIPSEMLATGRELVNTAVKLINGYMRYLKRAGKKSAVREEPAEYLTGHHNDTDDYPIANNR
jgi:four helix bundle protein